MFGTHFACIIICAKLHESFGNYEQHFDPQKEIFIY